VNDGATIGIATRLITVFFETEYFMKWFRKYLTADLNDFTLVQIFGITILSCKNFIRAASIKSYMIRNLIFKRLNQLLRSPHAWLHRLIWHTRFNNYK